MLIAIVGAELLGALERRLDDALVCAILLGRVVIDQLAIGVKRLDIGTALETTRERA